MRDECSDAQSEPRTEQDGRESRHFHSALPTFMPAGGEYGSNSSAEINPRTPWGPLRRDGRTPPSTARGHNREGRQLRCVTSNVLTEPVAPLERVVNARVRERVTVEQIQPLRLLSLSTVVVRKSEIFVMTRIFDSRTTERTGRPMARPVSPATEYVAGVTRQQVSSAVQGATVSNRDTEHATPSHDGSRTECKPEYPHRAGNLATVGVGSPAPKRVETAPFTARRMSSLCERPEHDDSVFQTLRANGRLAGDAVSRQRRGDPEVQADRS